MTRKQRCYKAAERATKSISVAYAGVLHAAISVDLKLCSMTYIASLQKHSHSLLCYRQVVGLHRKPDNCTNVADAAAQLLSVADTALHFGAQRVKQTLLSSQRNMSLLLAQSAVQARS